MWHDLGRGLSAVQRIGYVGNVLQLQEDLYVLIPGANRKKLASLSAGLAVIPLTAY